MKVTLFRDMRAEGWYSMDRYADCLKREYQRFSLAFSEFCVEPAVKAARVKMFWRGQIYPFLAGFHQGEVNHVLDHSYAHLLNHLNPQKTVVTCHDLIPLEYEENKEARAYFANTVANLSKASLVLADSQSTKKDLMNKLGIREPKIRVIYLGLDETFVKSSPEDQKELRRKLKLPDGKIILNHGNNLSYKNVEGTLKAFKNILAEKPETYLVRTHSLDICQRKLAEELGILSHYVEHLNPSDETLLQLYKASDVLLSPSLKEGFGLVVLEAMSFGLPVVISEGTSLQEVAGDLGVLVNPGDISDVTAKTLLVLSGRVPVNRDAMRQRALSFSWEKTARLTLSAYEEVVSRL